MRHTTRHRLTAPAPCRCCCWPPQASLYNGLAVARMKQGEWEDAERDLLEALGKDAKDPDTLANLVTVGLHLGKATSRYASQLKMLAPSHPMAVRAAAGEEMFDRAAAAKA